jgi:tetratricopeptide (TPR) repeat protein
VRALQRACLSCACAALAAGIAGADTLFLKDGRVFDGIDLTRGADGAVTLVYPSGTLVVQPDQVLEAFDQAAPDFVPSTPEEQAKLDAGQVPWEGKWVTKATREKLMKKRIDEQRARVEEMKAHSEWRTRRSQETKAFRYEYTVNQEVFEGLRDRMEAYFVAFCKDWKIKPPKEALPVCFYSNAREFHRTSGASANTLAYFRFVEPMDLHFYYDRFDPELTEDVMFHESNHYLQKLLDVGFKMPHFPGESLAEYYGASSYDEATGKFTTGLVQEGRLVEIKSDILAGESMSLERMVTTDGMYEHYTWGWSLVHFLMSDPKSAKKFQDFVRTLVGGKGVRRETGMANLKFVDGAEIWRVFRESLGLDGEEAVRAFEAAWHAYIEEELDFVSAAGKEKAAAGAMEKGQPIKARRLFQEAIEAGTRNPATFDKYARLLFSEGEAEAAVEQWRRALELDPLTGVYHWRLGEAHEELGHAEDAQREKALAREIEPETDYDGWSVVLGD